MLNVTGLYHYFCFIQIFLTFRHGGLFFLKIQHGKSMIRLYSHFSRENTVDLNVCYKTFSKGNSWKLWYSSAKLHTVTFGIDLGGRNIICLIAVVVVHEQHNSDLVLHRILHVFHDNCFCDFISRYVLWQVRFPTTDQCSWRLVLFLQIFGWKM